MSQTRLEACIQLPLEEKLLLDVTEKAKDWALLHGLGMRYRENFTKEAIQIAPFVLLPSPFPRCEFNKAIDLQPVLNELFHKVAHDDEFLERSLQNSIQVDEFTARLYDIWLKVKEEGISQPVSLGLFRSDYLLQAPQGNTIKQVEFNTIATSFGAMTSNFPAMFRYVLRQLRQYDIIKDLPENRSLTGLCAGITEAFDLFGSRTAVVVFVVEEVSYNICDQRFNEFEICEKRPDIQIHRKTLAEIYEETELDDKKQLLLDGKPVAVVYYRVGYESSQYPSAREWEARLRIERSTAIKCPSIQYQLAGTKKVQQILAAPGVLEKFMGEGETTAKVREIFTGLYSLDFDESGERAVEMALQDAERFVLKPQREGGGNNVYGAEVREALLRMRHSRERAAYILMERILPPLVSGYEIRAGGPMPPPLSDLVSELGIFGVIIGTKDKIYSNRQVGHNFRAKLADVDEGGVATGFGALDTPYLIDM